MLCGLLLALSIAVMPPPPTTLPGITFPQRMAGLREYWLVSPIKISAPQNASALLRDAFNDISREISKDNSLFNDFVFETITFTPNTKEPSTSIVFKGASIISPEASKILHCDRDAVVVNFENAIKTVMERYANSSAILAKAKIIMTRTEIRFESEQDLSPLAPPPPSSSGAP